MKALNFSFRGLGVEASDNDMNYMMGGLQGLFKQAPVYQNVCFFNIVQTDQRHQHSWNLKMLVADLPTDQRTDQGRCKATNLILKSLNNMEQHETTQKLNFQPSSK